MIRDYTAYYYSKTTDEVLEYRLGARSLSDATVTASELTPDGYVLKQLLYKPEWS